MKEKIAHLISIVFQPFLMPVYAVLLLVFSDMYRVFYTPQYRALLVGGVVFFTTILPLLFVAVYMKMGKVSDLFISNRKERTIPYLVSFLCCLLCIRFLIYMSVPTWVVYVALGATVSLVLITVINLWWKVSAHMSCIGNICGVVFGSALVWQTNPVWLFILLITISALVAWARLILKAHTPLQVLCGFLIGLWGPFAMILIAL